MSKLESSHVRFLTLLFVAAMPSLSTWAQDDPWETRTQEGRASALALVSETLAGDGFSVRSGEIRFLRMDEEMPDWDTYYGNNPSTPYGWWRVPHLDGEAIEPDEARGIDQFRLRPDEAVVFIGRTPPPCRYFSYRSYLYRRQYAPDRSRDLLGELGEPLNLTRIAPDEPGDGAPFDTQIAVITTASSWLDERLRSILVAQGFPPHRIYTDAIPYPHVRMGLDAAADTFAVLHRSSVFADEDRKEAYLDEPPAILLRVTPAREMGCRDPFGEPDFIPRGTGTTERALEPSLFRLASAVRSYYESRLPVTGTIERTAQVGCRMEGVDFIDLGIPTFAPCRDTIYSVGGIGTLEGSRPDSFLVAVGINHVATGKARYANLSVYDLRKMMGVAVATDQRLRGTADGWVSGARFDPTRFYVVPLARESVAAKLPVPSTERTVLSIPYLQPGQPGVPGGARIALAERAYLEETTTVGPAPDEVLAPLVVRFRAR